MSKPETNCFAEEIRRSWQQSYSSRPPTANAPSTGLGLRPWPRNTTDHTFEQLRELIANERTDRLALVATTVIALGYEVIAREIDVGDVGPVTAREQPDVALVGLGESPEHALRVIDKSSAKRRAR